MNSLPDIPRLYTALAEWGACIIYIMVLRRRLKGWLLVGVLGTALAVQSLFLHFTGLRFIGNMDQGFRNLTWLLCMVLAVGAMFLLIWGCCRIGPMDAAYCCIRAFVLAEFAASLEWQLHCFFWPSEDEPVLPAFGLLLTIYGGAFLLVWLVERSHMPRDGHMGINRRELCSAVVIGIAVFFVSNLGFVPLRTPFSSQYDAGVLIVRTVVDLGGLAILYAHHIQCCELRTRQELESIAQVLQNQYIQYQQSKENIDMLDRKYHDLKHQITILRAELDVERRNDYLEEMEREIKIYEAQNKTGNPVLDTILTSKNLYCVQHGIGLTCVVDGKLLAFMDSMDLSAIFGNALDNAIECEEQVADPERRLIHITVSAQKCFVLLTFENYFEGSLAFEEQFPVTTKGNRAFHGYGLKSIRYVAQKYGGTMAVSAENNWFELKILIPIPESRERDRSV